MYVKYTCIIYVKDKQEKKLPQSFSLTLFLLLFIDLCGPLKSLQVPQL